MTTSRPAASALPAAASSITPSCIHTARTPIRIELHIPVADVVIRRDRTVDDLARAMFPVEAARLHPLADRRVECAAAFFSHH